jgi:hypothetical protein
LTEKSEPKKSLAVVKLHMQTSNLNERFQPARPKADLIHATPENKDDERPPIEPGRKSQLPLQLLKLITFQEEKAKMLRFEA